MPCPFCGWPTAGITRRGHSIFVKCDAALCGGEGPKLIDQEGAEINAIARWNHRSGISTIGASPDCVHAHAEEEEVQITPTRDQLMVELAFAKRQAEFFQNQAVLLAEANRQSLERSAKSEP